MVPRLSYGVACMLALALVGCVPAELYLEGDGARRADGSSDSSPAAQDGHGDVVGADTTKAPEAGSDQSAADAPPQDNFVAVDSGPADAGTDLGVTSATIYCGDASPCPIPSHFCCVDTSKSPPTYATTASSSSAISSCTGGGSTAVECQEGADCPGQVCCGDAMFSGGSFRFTTVTCQSTCPFPSKIPFCNPASVPDECTPYGVTCKASTWLPGYYVCF